jgi:hypothetical protein
VERFERIALDWTFNMAGCSVIVEGGGSQEAWPRVRSALLYRQRKGRGL